MFEKIQQTMSRSSENMIVRVTIPISSWGFPDEHTDLELHFAGRSPSKEEVIQACKDYHNRDKEYPDYTGCWNLCLETLNLIEEKDWVYVYVGPGKLRFATHNIDHPTLGKVSFSWLSIVPIELECEEPAITIAQRADRRTW